MDAPVVLASPMDVLTPPMGTPVAPPAWSASLVVELVTYFGDIDFLTWLKIRLLNRNCASGFRTIAIPALCRRIKAKLATCLGINIWTYGDALSGGFLLDCMFDTAYSSDIDILVNAPPNSGLKHIRPKILHAALVADGYAPVNQHGGVHNFADTFVVRKFICDDKPPVDLIMIGDRYKSEYVRTYDFAFCRAYYDGNVVYIDDTEALITKHTEITADAVINIMRFADYDRTTWQYDWAVRAHDRTCSRAAKYAKRGFTVGLIPPLEVYEAQIEQLVVERVVNKEANDARQALFIA